MKRRTKMFCLVLTALLCVTVLFSAAAFAAPVGNTAPNVQIGVSLSSPTLNYYSGGAVGNISISAGTLPSGVIFSHVGGNWWRFEGTPAPGTAGNYPITLIDSGDSNTLSVTLTVASGPQTIVQPDITATVGDAPFQLTPHSTNGNGATISGTHTPTYTYGGGNAAVATIDATGNVTIVGVGSTTFTIDSAANASYQAATQKIVNITVNVRPPSALPKTGDGFPMGALLALLGAALAGLGWLGYRLRRQGRA